MSCSVSDEIDSIAAIYSENGEFTYDKDASRFTLQFTMQSEDVPVEMQCHIPDEYPVCIPHVYISKLQVTKSFLSKLNCDMKEHLKSNSFVGEAMLFEIIQWTQDYVECPTLALRV